MVWEEVHVVKNPPKKRKRNSPAKSRSSPTKRKGGSSTAARKGKKNPPGKVWRKGYTYKRNGKSIRVAGRYVKKGGAKRRRSNPSRRRTTTRRKAPARRRRANPRRRTTTRRRTTRRRNPSRRRTRRRRNPISYAGGMFGHVGDPHSGKWSVGKMLGQASFMGITGATLGILTAAVGPGWVQTNFGTGWDLTTGWRDPLWSAAFSLVGGMLIGRFVDKVAGIAFATAGLAVAAIKVIRELTSGGSNPIFSSGSLLGSGDLLGGALNTVQAPLGIGSNGGYAMPYGNYGTTGGYGETQVGLFKIQEQ